MKTKIITLAHGTYAVTKLKNGSPWTAPIFTISVFQIGRTDTLRLGGIHSWGTYKEALNAFLANLGDLATYNKVTKTYINENFTTPTP